MFWVENCVACAGYCVGCCWCDLLGFNVTRCKTKRKAEKKSTKKLAVPNIFGRILPKLVLAAKNVLSGMNSTSSACANCQKWFWLPKIFFGNVAANFEKVGNVNVFSSSDNCFSLCSRPRHQNVTTWYGASLGGALCFINNPTLRLLSYSSTYDE